MMQKKPRKRRSDRNHVIYKIVAPDAQIYVGITAQVSTPMQSVKRRWKKHVSRALREAHAWNLSQAIRQWGADNFTLEVLDKVRGKAEAHALEVLWIQRLAPQLNTAKTGMKGGAHV